jgi:hypothetical protein
MTTEKSKMDKAKHQINSPDHTDSTDEPTPLSIFNNNKGFKFSNGLIDEIDNDDNAIAFEDRKIGEKKKETNAVSEKKRDPSMIFGSQKGLFKSLFSSIGLKRGRTQIAASRLN